MLPMLLQKKSYATGKGHEVAVRGEKATTVVHLLDEEGKVSSGPAESLSCELTLDTNSDEVKGSVKRTKNGQFEISYQPTSRGRHQLHIKVKGEYSNHHVSVFTSHGNYLTSFGSL